MGIHISRQRIDRRTSLDFRKKGSVSILSPSISRLYANTNYFDQVPTSLIQLEQRRFRYPVDFRLDNGKEFLVTGPEDIKYTGEPSPEVDDAWHELLWGRYFSISEEEAKSLWGDNYEEFRDREKSGFTGG